MTNKLYYEDLEVGSTYTSPRRTITEADVVNFAGLSGDYNPLHTDEVYAKDSIFGERVAHGLLGLVTASGLFTRTELNRRLRGTMLALLGVNWKFVKPLKIGDTIFVESKVLSKRLTSSRERGIIVFQRSVINQNGDIIQQGEVPILIRTKS